MPDSTGDPVLIDGTDDPSQNLQNFKLTDLELLTREKAFASNASSDFHLFFVGRDDVHDILSYVISRVRTSLYLNMFGFDDDKLNAIIMKKVMDPTITVVITLDKSQAGGAHEKTLLDADRQQALADFNTHFTIGESLTHQITHTKGFVADGRVGAEGSTNWSDSGEGTFVVKDLPGGPGYKAQNNTQTVFTDQDSISRFQSELIAEHLAARDQESATTPASMRQQKPTMGKMLSAQVVAKAKVFGRQVAPQPAAGA